jgi:hypothetical protein
LIGFLARGKAVGFTAPPVGNGLQILEAERFGFGITLDTFRIVMLVKPDRALILA